MVKSLRWESSLNDHKEDPGRVRQQEVMGKQLEDVLGDGGDHKLIRWYYQKPKEARTRVPSCSHTGSQPC